MRPLLIVLSIVMLCGCEDPSAHDPENMSFEELQAVAPTGTAEQQFRLGMRYLRGDDVDTNPFNASIWFRMAAMQGHAEAMFGLAECYDESDLPENAEETIHWLRKAAELGHPRAMAFLGIELCGRAHGKDLDEGRKWLAKSAKHGSIEGMRAHAFQLLRQNKPEEGKSLYRDAALKGDSMSAVMFGLSIADAEPNSGQFIESLAWLHVGVAGDEAIPDRLFEMCEQLDERSAKILEERIKEIRILIKNKAG